MVKLINIGIHIVRMQRTLRILLIITITFSSLVGLWAKENIGNAAISPKATHLLEIIETKEAAGAYDEVVVYLDSLAVLLNKESKTEFLPDIYVRIGYAHFRSNQNNLALDNFFKVLSMDASDEVQADALKLISKVYRSLSNFNLAHEYVIKSAVLHDKLNDQEGLCGDYYDLGTLFFYQGNNKEALMNYRKAQSIAVRNGLKVMVFNTISALGSTYEKMGRGEMALDLYHEALLLANEMQYSSGISYALHNLGSGYANIGEYSKALSYFEKALKNKNIKTDKWGAAGTYLSIGKSLTELKEYKEAEVNLKTAARISKELNSKSRMAEVEQALAKLYKVTGQIYMEEKSLIRYIELRDSILNEETLTKIGGRKFAYEMQKKEKEIFLLQKQAEVLESKQKIANLRNQIGVLVATFVGITALFFFVNYRRQKALTAELQGKNEEISQITEKIKVQNHLLEQSNTELKNFAYVASHDLKEPLRMVNSFSGLLNKRYDTVLDDRGREYMYYITDAVERMEQLLDDLLNYSRLNTSTQAPEIVKTGNVAAAVKMNLTSRIEEKGAEVIIPFDKMPNITGYKLQFSQLLQNLIANGLKFHDGSRSPEVIVDVQERSKDYLFSIKDNGIGISENNKKKIFEMFTRLHTRQEFEGTGIGLSTCKKIVERHGGKIWVESVKGEGSTFFFTIAKNYLANEQ